VGFTLVEMLFALAIIATLAAVALPTANDAVDEMRTLMAARSLAARLSQIRIDAVTRSRSLALRFEAAGGAYRWSVYADGNGNGLRTADIAAGIDVSLGPKEMLGDKFPGVALGLLPGYPDADNVAGTGSDGVRIGTARILTMSPDGTATAGTLYLHGRRNQFAIRVLGATGRIRVLQYDQGRGTWITR
jgi:prepilin-type N-terminal cleavage/methylation domain-containing protein